MIVMKKDFAQTIGAVCPKEKKTLFILHSDVNMTFESLSDEMVSIIDKLERYDFAYELYMVNHNKLKLIMNNGHVNKPLYTICSKSGYAKLVNSLEEAKDLAYKKSTKACAYTVYENGEAIIAYKNKKELTNYKIVFKSTDFAKTTFIGVSEDKVRVKFVFTEYRRARIGDNVVSMKTPQICTYTFHKDGKVYYCNGKRVILCGCKTETFITMDDECTVALVKALIGIRPEIKKFEDIAIGYGFLDDFVVLYSFPNVFLRYDAYNDTYEERNRRFDIEVTRRIVEDNNIVKMFAKKFKDFPETKIFRKLYLKDINYLEEVANCLRLGFTNKDITYRLASSHYAPFMSDKKEQAVLEAFMNSVIRIKGESNAAKMLLEEDPRISCDIAMMINSFDIDIDAINFVIRKCSNIASMHDTLAGYSGTRRHRLENKEIKYSKKELKLEKDFGDVKFELAKDSKDLAIVGADMGICVGGYANAAASKQCIIVKMVNNGKYVGCIEIRDGDRLYQIKAKFNNPLELKYKDSLDQWISENKLKAECYDYDLIGQSWNSCHAYNDIDPTQYDRHEQHDENRIVIVKRRPYGIDDLPF